jgi:hypothetical protein
LVSSGIDIRGEKPRYDKKLISRAISMYINDKLSASLVAENLGLKTHTVKQWLRDTGSFRSMSEAACLHVAGLGGVKHTRGSRLEYKKKSTGETISADSSYEYHRMKQLDDDKDVVSWERCKDVIPYKDASGKTRNYNPDLKVSRRSCGIVIEEIKPLHFTNKPINIAKADAAISFYRAKGYKYKFVTEDDIGDVKAMKGIYRTKDESLELSRKSRRERLSRRTSQQIIDDRNKNNKAQREWRNAKLISTEKSLSYWDKGFSSVRHYLHIRHIKLDSSSIRGISKKCSNAEKRGEFSNVVSMSYGS